MLILASASPRRQELLRAAGIPFVVEPTEIPEIPRSGESGTACAERLAREKATVIWRRHQGDLVLGADTVVVRNREVLGKPVDAGDAARMLRLLSGRSHQVITGVCLKGSEASSENRKPRTFEDIRSATTTVYMAALSEQDIQSYIATGEPMDKAGAYAIQGLASCWIPRIEGDYSNVVGLPVALVYSMLRAHGAQW
jgi:nucleoside triphosphate pyrophosphatase